MRGNALLYAWADRAGVAYRRLGKLIVARTVEEEAALDALMAHAASVGVPGMRRIDRVDPDLIARAAVLSESTGIVDPIDLTASLFAAARAAGAEVVTAACVRGIASSDRATG